jgi:hypothetical protein
LLFSLIGGKYFFLVFLIILGGPFSFIFHYFNSFRVYNEAPDVYSLILAVGFTFAIGIVNLLIILSHSYWSNFWTAILTNTGIFTWFLFGMSIAFIGV